LTYSITKQNNCDTSSQNRSKVGRLKIL